VWTWAYSPADGARGARSAEFPSQADAEAWLGESWADLLDGGVAAVTLLEDAREVYGPMSLSPE
jgi:hypothetical protein